MNQATTGKRTSLSQPCSQGSTLDHWWSHVNRLRLVTNDGKLLQHRLAWICYQWRIAVLRPTTLALRVLDWTSDFCNPTLLNHDPQGFRCLLVGLSPQPHLIRFRRVDGLLQSHQLLPMSFPCLAHGRNAVSKLPVLQLCHTWPGAAKSSHSAGLEGVVSSVACVRKPLLDKRVCDWVNIVHYCTLFIQETTKTTTVNTLACIFKLPLNHDKSAFKNHCLRSVCPSELVILNHEVGMGQNLVPLVNIKIACKWMFIPLKMAFIGIDPWPGGTQPFQPFPERSQYRVTIWIFLYQDADLTQPSVKILSLFSGCFQTTE